ncbi:alkaline phosphatase [bacterium]|nr:alkaline phosphatase [bacterium]
MKISANFRRKALIIFSIFLFGFSEELPKSVIFFIGDGMGVSYISADYYTHGSTVFSEFDGCALMTVHPNNPDKIITKSSGSASAMATGIKTERYAISVDNDGNPLETVLEIAKKSGKSVGLVATSKITNATPAAFAAHNSDRYNEIAIAENMIEADVDVMFAGGMDFFLPKQEGGQREDERNLLKIAANRGDVVARNPEEILSFDVEQDNGNWLGFISMDDPGPVQERGISLKTMMQKALEKLSKNPNGYFLMVEGSQIDWYGHNNDFPQIMKEMDEFTEAISFGFELAEHDSEILLLCAADHETGGLTIESGDQVERKITVDFTTDRHTAEMVVLFWEWNKPIFSSAIVDNADVGKWLVRWAKK